MHCCFKILSHRIDKQYYMAGTKIPLQGRLVYSFYWIIPLTVSSKLRTCLSTRIRYFNFAFLNNDHGIVPNPLLNDREVPEGGKRLQDGNGLHLEQNFWVGQERGAGVRNNGGWDGVKRGERGTWSSKRAGSWKNRENESRFKVVPQSKLLGPARREERLSRSKLK